MLPDRIKDLGLYRGVHRSSMSRGAPLAERDTMLAVILCGGSGTRLWPVSREAMPKPFMKIGAGPSLLQRTALRCAGWCGRLHRRHERRVHVQNDRRIRRPGRRGPAEVQLLLEPIGRNTAPAIAAACVLVERQARADEPRLSSPPIT